MIRHSKLLDIYRSTRSYEHKRFSTTPYDLGFQLAAIRNIPRFFIKLIEFVPEVGRSRYSVLIGMVEIVPYTVMYTRLLPPSFLARYLTDPTSTKEVRRDPVSWGRSDNLVGDESPNRGFRVSSDGVDPATERN